MSLPDQIAAYNDCFDAFDEASANPRGVRVPFETEAAAKQFQLRMHNARAIDRQEARRIHERNTPQYGKSEYDRLCVRNPREKDGKWWVYIEPYAQSIGGIEPL